MATAGSVDLSSLSRGFRDDFVDYETLTEQLKAWTLAYPELARLESIGESPEGRQLWLLTIGLEPDRVRPAVWVDANMHASELAGTNVALGIAEDILRMHLEPDAGVRDVGERVRSQLRDVLFYVLPRMSPDGAEAVLKTGRWVRSVPRDDRPDHNRARWRSADIDGDGRTLLMRMEDETGEYVESQSVPGLMLVRELEDEGPFYKLFPEGVVDGFDGRNLPSPGLFHDNTPDLNRNFPYTWAPEPRQAGAGAYALSEPESRAVVEFTTAHPNIFIWLNLHTFGGVFIRPLGNAPDTKMHPYDLAVFRQVEQWGETHTGYPTVSGFEEFTYEPEEPLYGDLTDYAYHQRGALAYVCELWDFFEQVGLPRPKRFVDRYRMFDRDALHAIGRWDAEHNEGRLFHPWTPVVHPQLGSVEVGGLDARFGVWNPPKEKLAEICAGQSAAFLRVSALCPRVRVTAKVEPADGDVSVIRVQVDNLGYLPTTGLPSAAQLPWNEPLQAQLVPHGCKLGPGTDPLVEIGHLDGWGRGHHGEAGSLFFLRSRGSTSTLRFDVPVTGHGTVHITVRSCRTGATTVVAEV